MKKGLSCILVLALVLSVTGCFNRNKNNNTTETESETTTQQSTQQQTTTQEQSMEESSTEDVQTDELLMNIHDAVAEAYGENYLPNMSFDGEYLESVFGITEDMYESYIAEGPLISANIDTFIGIKAESGREDEVYAALEAYRDYWINDSVQYPTNAIKVQASQTIQHGEYVFFICLGTISMETEERGDDAILEEANAQNQIGADIIHSFFEE